MGIKMKHPMGTYLISVTEFIEKFSYFIFAGTLVLFMNEVLHFSIHFSALLYGIIASSCYFFQVVSGYLTDVYLGNRKSVIIGGILMIISQLIFTYDGSLYYLTESVPTHSTLLFSYPEIIFIIGVIFFSIGASFIKISVTSFIGLFYEGKEELLDSAYTTFYMITNFGPLLAPVVLSIVVGIGYPHLYQYGFFIGAIVLLIGLIIFILFKDKYLVDAHGEAIGNNPISEMIEEKMGENPSRAKGGNLSKIEIDRVKVIFLILIICTVFYCSLEQILTSLIVIAIHYVNNTIPFTSFTLGPQIYISLNAVFVIILSPIFLKLMPKLAERNKEPSSLGKLGIGTFCLTLAFASLLLPTIVSSGKIHMGWMVVFNFFLSAGEIFIIPIGLSLISKLAPVRYRSLMMGIMFTATAIAEIFSGVLASAVPLPNKSTFLFGIIPITNLSSFIWIFILTSGIVGILWFIFKNRIHKLMHGID